MADRLRFFGRRLRDLGTGLVDALVRDNRVLPPVLAVLVLFVIAWILAGAFMTQTDQKPVAHRADLARSELAQSDLSESDPDPGVENRDVNSYAAYRSKDPFRQLIAPEETAAEEPTATPEQTTPETTTPDDDTGAAPGGNRRDTDGDGVPDRRERNRGTDPNNPDTDGDGVRDRSDDTNDDASGGTNADTDDDGRPGTGTSGTGTPGTGAPGAGTGTGAVPGTNAPGRDGARAPGNRRDDLLDSGGTLPSP